MSIDLNILTKDELEKLQSEVGKALTSVETRRRAEALQAARDAAKSFGYSLEELMSSAPTKSKSPPKYANPNDRSQTWTGRGRKPQWMIDALQAGKSLDDLSI